MLLWLRAVSIIYGVEPELALAVARIESGCKASDYRLGPMGCGTYYGPMGIFYEFIKRWPIDDPYINILVGVKALRGQGDPVRVLRRYNTTATQAYLKAVLSFRKMLRDSKFFDLLVLKERLNEDDGSRILADQGGGPRLGQAGAGRGVQEGWDLCLFRGAQ
jgi:hypothetical protein